MDIIPAEVSRIGDIRMIAHNTWPAAYGNILPAQQIDYMLELFYSPDALKAQMEDGQCFFIALINDKPVAFAAWQMISPHLGKLQKLYVLPEVQGRNIGNKLLDHVITSARNEGAKKLELNVNRHNPAKVFYEKAGFTINRTADIDIGHGYFMNDYIMSLPLT